jgi:hypothetical protein
MKVKRLMSLLGVVTLAAPLSAIGAGISATYRPVTPNQWLVDFVVTGDGTPSVINDFTIYFPDATFASLSLAQSPAGWDSLLVQPDPTLHSAGFLDSLALGTGIGNGGSVGGFEVKFNFLGQGVPPALHFDINDANFHAVFSGVTSVTAVPEPEIAWLMLLGFAAIAGSRIRAKKQHELGLEA